MLSAFTASILFLTSYVIYHYHTGSTPFSGQGWIRPVYFGLLISHVTLAAVILPLAVTTLYRRCAAISCATEGSRAGRCRSGFM